MAYRNAQTAYRRLLAAAQRQGGYVTARQALRAEFGYSHLAYHVAAGNLERAGHGLYRLPEVPRSAHDQLVRLVLWSRGRDDRPQAVVSHDTALALHELSDVLPQRVHLSVPPGFRKRAPRGCVLHVTRLAGSDIDIWEGLRVTTPLRTLIDLADEGRLGREQLDRAVEDALARGLVRRGQVQEALRAAGAPVTRARPRVRHRHPPATTRSRAPTLPDCPDVHRSSFRESPGSRGGASGTRSAW
jgi:predicted transcriptional regulator of viral defense system